jgi:hypothetical protein
MRIAIRNILTIVFLVSASSAYAQSEYNDSSIYSYLGLGIPIDNGSSQGAGMGLSGVSVRSMIHGNTANPAILSATRFTLLNGGFTVNYTDAVDDFSQAKSSQLKINTFQLQLPLIREKLGMSISLQPLTESRFSLSTNSEYIRPSNEFSPADTINYNIFTRGDGGLNKLEAGIGYQLHNNISIGYAASVIFGSTNAYRESAFSQSGYSFITENERTSYVGMGNRFGIYADYTRPFAGNDYIAFGATLSLPVDLTTEITRNANYGNQQIPLADKRKGTSQLPIEYNLGLSYYANQYVMISTEALVQQWSNYENFSGFNEEFMKNRVKLGLGFEYAAIRRPENSILTRFIYRAGFSVDSGHLELNGTDIKTLMFSAGLGIPSPASGSSIDVNFDFGIRGTTSHELVKEKIYAVRVSFNLSEMMFLQRRLQ